LGALAAYHRADRTHPLVMAYFENETQGKILNWADGILMYRSKEPASGAFVSLILKAASSALLVGGWKPRRAR
jgi:hypothetical protein